MSATRFQPFKPHPLLRGPHSQTLLSLFFPGRLRPYRAVQRQVELEDGDRVVLHDDCPARWLAGDPVALLIHGLGGCHQSPYMRRLAGKLVDRRVRVFRMDLRGCGAGAAFARLPYHGGRSDDVRAALAFLERLCPGSPAAVVGFSLGGNVALKLAGESSASPIANLASVAAVCPPIDLAACVDGLQALPACYYDRYFVTTLAWQLRKRRKLVPDMVGCDFTSWPRRMRDLDDLYTARVSGFGTADTYYARCSSNQFLSTIEVPTLIVASKDDPLIPVRLFRAATVSPAVEIFLTDGGGHLGFVARRGDDPDRFWIDWRLIDWIQRTAPSQTESIASST